MRLHTTSTGIKIGCMYTPPACIYLEHDAVLLQKALVTTCKKSFDWHDKIVLIGCAVAVIALLGVML